MKLKRGFFRVIQKCKTRMIKSVLWFHRIILDGRDMNSTVYNEVSLYSYDYEMWSHKKKRVSHLFKVVLPLFNDFFDSVI